MMNPFTVYGLKGSMMLIVLKLQQREQNIPVTCNNHVKSVDNIRKIILVPMKCHRLHSCVTKCPRIGIHITLNIWTLRTTFNSNRKRIREKKSRDGVASITNRKRQSRNGSKCALGNQLKALMMIITKNTQHPYTRLNDQHNQGSKSMARLGEDYTTNKRHLKQIHQKIHSTIPKIKYKKMVIELQRSNA